MADDESNGDYTCCCVLADADNNLLATLPLAAWPQLMAWHRNPNARPLMMRDEWSQIVRFDRSTVSRIYRRDMESVVQLEDMQRQREARRCLETGE